MTRPFVGPISVLESATGEYDDAGGHTPLPASPHRGSVPHLIDPLAQVLHRDVEHHFLRPLDQECRNGVARSRIRSNRTGSAPRPPESGCIRRAGTLPGRPLRVPHHPVVAPVVFEELLVGEAHDLDRRLHVVRPAVGIRSTPRRPCAALTTRTPPRYRQAHPGSPRRRVDHHFAGSSDRHTGKS